MMGWVHPTPVTFLSHQTLSRSLSELGMPNSVTQIEETLQFNSKNDKSWKRDDVFLIWSDALPQLSIGQPPDRRQKSKRYQMHMTCIDQWIILAYVQILFDFEVIRFKFHDQINQRPISFQSVILKTVQCDKRFYASWWSVKLCPNSNKRSWSMQGAYFRSHTRSAYQLVQISQGLPMNVPNHLLYT
jgi:hypothetical protein